MLQIKKKIIRQGRFTQINLLKEHQILEQKWSKNSDKMTEIEFKNEMLSFLNCFKNSHYEKFIVDASNLNFMIDTHVQDWVVENITYNFTEKVNKAAFVIPKGIFERTSIKQTNEGAKESKNKTLYFKNREIAYKWLIEDIQN